MKANGDMTAESGLRLTGITKKYGELTVVRDVSLDIPKGSFFVLLGESGCGKTTLLRIIAGFEKPDGGRVYVSGKDVTDLPPGERGCSTAHQSLALFDHMSAAGNIAFVLGAKKQTIADGKKVRISGRDARAEAERILSDLGLGSMAGRRTSTLSGGEKQRVAIARAVALGAEVLLLDEPTGSLDAGHRLEADNWLTELCRKTGMTVVCVTHDREEAMRMGDMIAVMSGGRILRTGTPEQVYSDPQSAEAARLTGECGIIYGRASGGVALFTGGIEAACDCGDCPVAAYIRPETVRVSREGIEGSVAECVYTGSEYMLTVNVACGHIKAADDKPHEKGSMVRLELTNIKAVKA